MNQRRAILQCESAHHLERGLLETCRQECTAGGRITREIETHRGANAALPKNIRSDIADRFLGCLSHIESGLSTDKQTRCQCAMLHGAPIQHRRKAIHRFESEERTELRSFRDRWLKIPENARGFVLTDWQKALARGDNTCRHLVKIRENGAGFREAKRRTHQAECCSMMDQTH